MTCGEDYMAGYHRTRKSRPLRLGRRSSSPHRVDAELDEPVPPPGSPEALAAVERLTTLFADLPIATIDAVLDDPCIALENAPFVSDETA